MRRLSYKLVFVVFLAMITMSFSGVISLVAEAEYFYNFTRNLTVGSKGDDVMALQQFLNSHGALVSADGFGSPGNETIYFGRATKAALAKWQGANGISPNAGYFGLNTRLAVAAGGSVLSLISAPVPSTSLYTSPVNPIGQVGSEFPTRLKIPKINVDAQIEHAGLTSQGAMDVPKGPANVTWFNLGPRPGETGSSVMSGHYGWKDNISAVFDGLNRLQKGDRIYVEDDMGAIITFVVRESRTYGENEDASEVFSSSDGKAHLNLVTCQGVWNKDRKSYSERLVVFATASED